MPEDPAQVVQGIIAKERFELEDQYRAEKDEPEACFIEEALQYLSQRESGIDMPKELIDDVISEESSSNGSSSADEATCFEHYPDIRSIILALAQGIHFYRDEPRRLPSAPLSPLCT